MDLPPTKIATLVGSTGVLSVFLTQLWTTWRERSAERRGRRRAAAYLAMRLAVILEEYVGKCIFASWRDASDLERGATALDPSLPDLSDYPQDGDWRSLDVALAGRALSFRNEVSSATLTCTYEAMHEGNGIASADETILSGADAWRLAKVLRDRYRLGAVEMRHSDGLVRSADAILRRRSDFASDRLRR